MVGSSEIERPQDPGGDLAFLRLRELVGQKWSLGALQAFHTQEKLLLMAHCPRRTRALGRVLARWGDRGQGLALHEFYAFYLSAFTHILARAPTRGRHVDVLQHMVGYFRKDLEPRLRLELLEVVDAYAAGEVSLEEPVGLLRQHAWRLRKVYLLRQSYLRSGAGAMEAA